MRKLTPTQREEIKVRYLAGESPSALASEYGLKTIRHITRPKPGPRPTLQEQSKQLVEDAILPIIQRGPCTRKAIEMALGITTKRAHARLVHLVQLGKICVEWHGKTNVYHIADPEPDAKFLLPPGYTTRPTFDYKAIDAEILRLAKKHTDREIASILVTTMGYRAAPATIKDRRLAARRVLA